MLGAQLSRLAGTKFIFHMGEIYPGWTGWNFIPANQDHVITTLGKYLFKINNKYMRTTFTVVDLGTEQ